MKSAAFLDRDGVVALDTGYPHDPDTIKFSPGAVEAIKHLNSCQYKVIIISNQSGVGRGYFTLEQMHAYNTVLLEKLNRQGARIDAVYCCPFHPDAVDLEYRHPDHPDRKPNPGMIERAIKEHDLFRNQCFLIGDRQTDMQAAQAAQIIPILYKGGSLSISVQRGMWAVEAAFGEESDDD